MGKKKNKNKYNFERRRAIKCKFIEKSKTSPGYLKYEVTICEKDGTKHKQPAYGVDMQSAIARLVNQERTIQIEKKVYQNPFIVAIAWIAIMAWPVVITGANAGASFVLLSFGGVLLVMLLGVLWYNYINKK
tara:strand:+ start:186 stop:581 length:396 start_codon:yes stop_codon:yes gene_type:complete